MQLYVLLDEYEELDSVYRTYADGQGAMTARGPAPPQRSACNT